jgi:hypothetical protein
MIYHLCRARLAHGCGTMPLLRADDCSTAEILLSQIERIYISSIGIPSDRSDSPRRSMRNGRWRYLPLALFAIWTIRQVTRFFAHHLGKIVDRRVLLC